MPRGIRKAAIPQLPKGVNWATHVPLLVIPSGGTSPKADGVDGALRNRTSGANERDVKLQYPGCCDEHKKAITVASLVTDQELLSICSRFSQHYGHGRLQPARARIEWVSPTGKAPCEDCLDEYHTKQQQVA